MTVTVTETTRLRLRQLTSADTALVIELTNDADFIANVGDRGIRTAEDARRYIAEGPAASYTRYGFGLYLVELKAPALALGMCGLLRRDSHPDVEIGFAFLPPARGQGYALEAASATMKLGVESLGLKRIVAITAPDNRGSIRILERIGLKFERMVQFTDDGRDSRLFVFETPPISAAT